MTRSVFFITAILCVLSAFPACAMPVSVDMDLGDILTDCPLIHPDKPEVKLKSGHCVSFEDKDLTAQEGDVFYSENGWDYTFWLILKDIDAPRHYDAKLVCEYQDGGKIMLPIVGELVSCGWKHRPNKENPESADEYGRFWSESQVRNPE